MKKVYLFFTLALLYQSLIAQVWQGGYEIYTQEDADNFPVECGCTEITGLLRVYYHPDLTNLDSLYKLTTLGNTLDIADTFIENLDGLSNLSYVGGNVYIYNNPNLANVNGLSSLSYVEGDFSIQRNPGLVDLDGLYSLNRVDDLAIWMNVNLLNIDGLYNINYIGGDLEITDNSNLESCCLIDCWINNGTYQGDFIFVGNNGSGCYTLEEIQDLCMGDCTVTSLEETTSDSYSYQVYPNPAKDLINITYNVNRPTNVEITLTDLLGKQLLGIYKTHSSPGFYNAQIHMENFSNGVYFIRLYDDEFLSGTQKLLLNR